MAPASVAAQWSLAAPHVPWPLVAPSSLSSEESQAAAAWYGFEPPRDTGRTCAPTPELEIVGTPPRDTGRAGGLEMVGTFLEKGAAPLAFTSAVDIDMPIAHVQALAALVVVGLLAVV
eukprot:CAMPEP_0115138998 /NCGR_PEP_ID=MMETSP0227-20121206/58007_1 /TAXON_ID=89957 /ORGANISM="Polarella glacialis, Strain CCMP 1383" /LENGTH=117 /DNA_ID=CAMNT_0002546739 /DNA_START=41 /DNA_END=389 /DNA_ORIENTATION=+